VEPFVICRSNDVIVQPVVLQGTLSLLPKDMITRDPKDELCPLAGGFAVAKKEAVLIITTGSEGGLIPMPIKALVGRHGEDLAKIQVAAGVNLDNEVQKALQKVKLSESEKELIRLFTFRKNKDNVTREASQTITGGMSILTADVMNGTDGLELMEEIYEQKLLQQIASGAVFGQIAEMFLENKKAFPVNPITKNAEGKLALGPLWRELFLDEHQKFMANGGVGGSQTGEGCPVAGVAVGLFLDLYLDHIDYLKEESSR